MVLTHCLPSGSLGTDEQPIPNISTANCTTFTPAGAKRGIVVALHGLGTATIPVTVEDVGGFFPSHLARLSNSLKADGWIVAWPLYVGDDQEPGGAVDLHADIAADAGKGSRYLSNALKWWEHVKYYLRDTYDPAMPVAAFGASWGAWHVYQLVKNREEDLLGWAAHVGPPILSNVNGFSPDFGTLDTSGLDVGLTGLNAVAKPGIIGWQDGDPLVPGSDVETLFNNADGAGVPVTGYDSTGTHTVSTTDADTYSTWFSDTLSPLAPANF